MPENIFLQSEYKPAVLWVAYTLLAYAFSFVVYRTALWVCG